MPNVKRLQVTFADTLPMGERGTFTHDGDLWIAYRAAKNQRIFSVLDRMVNIHQGIHDEMLRWIEARPNDAAFIVRVIEKTSRALRLHAELVDEKTKAAIS